MKKLMERVEEVERVNARFEKKEKEKEFKFSMAGCEKQFKFNGKLKELFGYKLRVEQEEALQEWLARQSGAAHYGR